jgi:hypothetical protein
MNRQLLRAFAACALITVAAGCGTSVKGRWTGTEVEPELARDEVKFLAPETTQGKLVSVDLNLQKDKTFSAAMIYDTTVVNTTGTWEYKDRTLSLRDSVGNSYVYTVDKDGDELTIVTPIKGTEVKIELELED